MTNPFLVFSLVFGLAVSAGMAARLIRQPAFLGHVIVGLVVGYWGLVSGGEIGRLLEVLSSAGVMLLLFLVGLEMNIREVKKLGQKALVVGFGQIGVTTGLFVLLLLRLVSGGWLPLLVLAVSLAFSSTIVVVRLLSEKHDLESVAGKMAVTILLIQDLAAIVMLIVFGGRGEDSLLALVLKVVLLVLLTVLMARSVMPRVLHRLSKSVDELILFSLAWCFVLAAVVASPVFGLSLEIGGFLAGLALSGSFEHGHIAHKIKPIRDFFLTVFFVGLGLNLRLDGTVIFKALYLALAVIFLKPVFVWFLMRLFGYKQRVAFYTGLLFGQISEFSFILVAVGAKSGFWDQSLASLVSLVGLMTMVVSSYLIIDNEAVFRLFKPLLNFVWKDRPGDAEVAKEQPEDHIILFGCHRMGRSMLLHLAKNKEKILIVDFDPEVVARLRDEGWQVIYADAADTETYDQLNLAKAKMLVSTVRDLKDNLLMLAEIGRRRLKIAVVVDAETLEDAKELYEAGATYVIFPHFVGGLHLSDLIKRGVRERGDFEAYRKNQQEIMAGIYA